MALTEDLIVFLQYFYCKQISTLKDINIICPLSPLGELSAMKDIHCN